MRYAGLIATIVLVSYAVPTVARIGVGGPNGFIVQMNASFEPAGEPEPSGISATNEGRIHRFVPDKSHQRYFAYDLVMVAIETDRLRVHVEPLSLSASEIIKLPFLDRLWSVAPLPKPPAATEIKDGDRLVVDLLQTDGLRVVDNLVFTRRPPAPRP